MASCIEEAGNNIQKRGPDSERLNKHRPKRLKALVSTQLSAVFYKTIFSFSFFKN